MTYNSLPIETKLHLITSFYTATNPSRNTELEKALQKNIESEYIEQIHLFVDDELSLDKLHKKFSLEKITVVKIGKQPFYSDLVLYANLLENKLCMIINSDIWLHSIDDIRLLSNMPKSVVYSLTRHESDMTCELIDDYAGSHDAFIYHSPIHQSIIKHIQFPQNVWGSENVMMYEINKLNYTILNPCRQIKIVHEHMSNERNERNESRIRINNGDIDGDGIYKHRSSCASPCFITV